MKSWQVRIHATTLARSLDLRSHDGGPSLRPRIAPGGLPFAPCQNVPPRCESAEPTVAAHYGRHVVLRETFGLIRERLGLPGPDVRDGSTMTNDDVQLVSDLLGVEWQGSMQTTWLAEQRGRAGL